MATTPWYQAVHTTKRFRLGTVKTDITGYEYIYLKGVASTIAGSVVTFDSAGTSTLIVADASGPVAVAMAVTDTTSKYGWYGRKGRFTVDVVASSAAVGAGVKNPGRETTDGKVGDGRAAGDEINNFFQVTATTAAALVSCDLFNPFVNNFTGA